MTKRATGFLVPFISGLLFAVGLGWGGMTIPERVVGFLDVTGSWDPSLALVMLGAVTVYSAAYWASRRATRPALAASFHYPEKSRLDARLLVGSAIFGAGWGLAGYCPGPALVSAASGAAQPVLFSVAMLGALWLTRRIDERVQRGALEPRPQR